MTASNTFGWAVDFRIHTEQQAHQVVQLLFNVLPDIGVIARPSKIEEIESLADASAAAKVQVSPAYVAFEPHAHALFGTCCLVELRPVPFDAHTGAKKTFGKLLAWDPITGNFGVLDLTLSWYLVTYAAVLKCLSAKTAQLGTRGLSRLKCKPTDLESVLIDFGVEFERPELTEKLAHDSKDVIRFINKEFEKRALPRLLKGGVDKGYWINTHPANVRLTHPPSFAFAQELHLSARAPR